MSDFRGQVEAAAAKAIELGGNDPRLIVEEFAKRSPTPVRLPGDPSEREVARISRLIEKTASHSILVYGKRTSDYESVVALGKNSGRLSFGCSGIFASRDIILTAGHCINKGYKGAAWALSREGEVTPLPAVVRAEHHEKYGKPKIRMNDIGLIRLEKPVEKIPLYPIASSATIDNMEQGWIVGYGHNRAGAFGVDKKTHAPIHVRRNLSDGSLGISDLEFVVGDPVLSQHPGPGKDACEQDSGGPVLVDVAGRLQLAGLISRSVGGKCGNGSICVRLDRYAPWIDEMIEKWGGQKRPLA